MISFIVNGYENIMQKLFGIARMDPAAFHKKAAVYVIKQIKKRTKQGQDVDEKKFFRYSPSWAGVRRRAGKTTKKVNLSFEGVMLSAITYKADNEKALIFFSPTVDSKGMPSPEKAYFNQKGIVKRRFFAMSDKDIEALLKMLDETVAKVLR